MTLGQFIQIYDQEIPSLDPDLRADSSYQRAFHRCRGSMLPRRRSNLPRQTSRSSRSYQTSLGVQRDLGHDMILQVDWARPAV